MLNESDSQMWLVTEILKLKKEKNAIILAHYYQSPSIQEVADFIGDSLGLSKKAAETDAAIIVFAGVFFMAETAKILSPKKKVLLPDFNAGCSLADSCPVDDFQEFRDKHPGHIAITYINCSAEVKAISDIICTSSNALKIVNSIPKDTPIIFAPDKNLGKYINKISRREMLLWDGVCEVHEAFSLEKLTLLKKKYPISKLIAHPESESSILERADFIGSTASMIEFVKKDGCQIFIVATEAGILHQMSKAVPGKTLIPAPAVENNTCACSECRFMKMNTLEKLYKCLADESPEINVDSEIIEKALIPLKRMLNYSAEYVAN